MVAGSRPEVQLILPKTLPQTLPTVTLSPLGEPSLASRTWPEKCPRFSDPRRQRQRECRERKAQAPWSQRQREALLEVPGRSEAVALCILLSGR